MFAQGRDVTQKLQPAVLQHAESGKRVGAGKAGVEIGPVVDQADSVAQSAVGCGSGEVADIALCIEIDRTDLATSSDGEKGAGAGRAVQHADAAGGEVSAAGADPAQADAGRILRQAVRSERKQRARSRDLRGRVVVGDQVPDSGGS